MDMLSVSTPPPDVGILALLVATVLGAGLVEPLRAGLALVIAFPLIVVFNRMGVRASTGALLAVLAVAGWWAAEAWAEATGTSDDRRIVADEVVGAAAGAALAGRMALAPLALFGLAFLALDRLKPWPFSATEALPGAFGVMGDDLVVAVACGLAVRLVRQAGWPKGA